MAYTKYTGNWIENFGTKWRANIIDTDDTGTQPGISFANIVSYARDYEGWEIGVVYEVKVTVTNYLGTGTIYPPYDSTGPNIPLVISRNGIYTYDYTPTNTGLTVYSNFGHTADIEINYIRKKGSSLNIIPNFTKTLGSPTVTQGILPIEVDIMAGFTIEYDAGISDVIKSSIITSTYTLPLNNDGSLDSFLPLLNISQEGRYLLSIDKYDNSDYYNYWYGIIQQDFGGQKDIDGENIDIVAVDGLATLKDLDYEAQGTIPSNFLEYFHLALNEIPTANLFSNSDIFLKTRISWSDDRMPSGVDPLLYTNVNNEIFKTITEFKGYNGVQVTEIDNMGWYELLENILSSFMLRLVLVNGSWHIITVGALANSGNVFNTYTKASLVGSTETIILNKAIDKTNFFRSNGSFGYLPAIKKVKCKYLSKDGGNLLPSVILLDTTYESRLFIAGTGNYLSFSSIFYISGSTNAITLQRLYLKLTIKVGSYYYTNAGWTTSVGYYELASEYVNTFLPGNFFRQASFAFFTTDIPVTETGSIKVEIDTTKGIGLLATTLEVNTYNFSLLYIIGNEEPADYVEWVSENNNNYSLVSEIDDSLFGTSGSPSAKGFLQTSDGYIIPLLGVAVFADSNLWNNGGDDMFFNELLVNETLSLQSKVLLKYMGDINLANGWLDILNTISFDYNEISYKYIPNRITYNDDLWSGDWVEISADNTNVFNDSGSFDTKSDKRDDTFNGNIQEFLNPLTGDLITEGKVAAGEVKTANADLDDVKGVADTALSDASAADLKADGAVTVANTANTTANTALTNAATADSKAVTAQSTADSAETKAENAKTAAASASILANNAQSAADAARTTADATDTFVATFAEETIKDGSTILLITADELELKNLPTADPKIANKIYIGSGNALLISTGI